MLAADNWCVKVDDKIYGPYTSEQMRKYAHEGRLAAWSLIAPAGSRAWCEASREAAFARFFGNDVVRAKKAPSKTFGKKDDAIDAAGDAAQSDSRAANFVLIFDVVSAAASRVEAAVMSLGPAFRLADNVWTVSCELTAVGVRNAVAPYLSPNEPLFVIDATRGRSSWQNFAPEMHSKISAAYTAPRAVVAAA